MTKKVGNILTPTPNKILLDKVLSLTKNKPIVTTANTNIVDVMQSLNITQEDLKPEVVRLIGELLDAMCIDWRRDPNSSDTPNRVAKMLLMETWKGRYEPKPKITVFPNTKDVDQMITVTNLRVESICSHHHQNIRGVCHIGYIPKSSKDGGNVVGLSKFSRLIDWFARRPQIQEELTAQICDAVVKELNPLGCGVVIEAEHLCMACRGVHEPNARTITKMLQGIFLDSAAVRTEFYSDINNGK